MRIEQMSLFAPTAGPVRATDPSTSKEAAALPGREILRNRVLVALVLYGPQTDENIAAVLDEEDRKDSVSKRRGELVVGGFARPAKKDGAQLYGKTKRGSRAILWEATMAGKEIVL